uniref:Vesicle transport protein GOT1B n=1 Tax=Salarias fasciatus TaxID=181472 RepID=A0A672IK91_SALFA
QLPHTDTKIGMGLTGFGVFFLFFGMILFFDKALLAIGNILFVAGLSFVIGLERTFRFFFQKHKMKATSFFLGGVLVVLIGWPIVGVVLEIYGFFLLFRGFFPVVVGFIRRIPVLGSILNLPFISAVSMKLCWVPAACLIDHPAGNTLTAACGPHTGVRVQSGASGTMLWQR